MALPANGSYVETVVLPSGEMKVTHWIRTKVPESSIKLMAPVLAGIDSGVVTATEVQVVADGMVVPGADSVEGAGQTYQFVGTKSIYVTYVLSGALETKHLGGEPGARARYRPRPQVPLHERHERAERAGCRGAQPGLLASRHS